MERTNSARGAKIKWAKIKWSENLNEAKFEKSKVCRSGPGWGKHFYRAKIWGRGATW